MQSLGVLGNLAGPTVADTRPPEPISEGKVHGLATGSEQAAQLELALNAPIRPRCIERIGRSREAPRR